MKKLVFILLLMGTTACTEEPVDPAVRSFYLEIRNKESADFFKNNPYYDLSEIVVNLHFPNKVEEPAPLDPNLFLHFQLFLYDSVNDRNIIGLGSYQNVSFITLDYKNGDTDTIYYRNENDENLYLKSHYEFPFENEEIRFYWNNELTQVWDLTNNSDSIDLYKHGLYINHFDTGIASLNLGPHLITPFIAVKDLNLSKLDSATLKLVD